MNKRDQNGKTILVILCFAAIYLIWGTTYAAIRVAVQGLPPYLMNAIRCLVGGAVLYGVLRLGGAPRPRREQWRAAVIPGLLMLAGSGGLISWAEQRVDSGLAATMMASVPAWMVLLDWLAFGGQRPRSLTLAGMGAGFAGVAVLCTPSGGGEPGPVLALALAAPLWSLGSLAASRWRGPERTAVAPALQLLVGALALAMIGAVRGEPALVTSAAGLAPWLALAYLALFGSALAFAAYSWLLKNVGPSATSTYALVNPVVALLVGGLQLGERLDAQRAAGAVLVLAAVALILARDLHAPAKIPLSSGCEPRPL